MDRAEQLKREAQEQIAAHRGELEELSLRIHDNPELSLEEEKSSQWLAEYLSGKGFEVTKPAYGLPTAFEAVYGEGSPSIGIIAEYDALPRHRARLRSQRNCDGGAGRGAGRKGCCRRFRGDDSRHRDAG